jgi:hypothetical protein
MRPNPAWIALVAVACGRSEGGGPAPEARAPASDPEAVAAPPCQAQAFADELALPEASAATWLEVDGAPAILVVGDSGTRGAYALIDPTSGAVRERGALPLGDGASDDLEGITASDGRVWGLTSAGWMRVWKRDGAGFALVDGPYPIAPVDGTVPRWTAHGSATDSLACAARGTNCGKNYEGLCLRAPATDDACAGFAASRADGRLWCLVRDGARVVADGGRSIAVARPLALTGCDFAPDGDALWAGTNLLDAARVYRVDGWRTPATARAVAVASLPVGFPEALAVGPAGAIYRFSDTGNASSAQGRYRCR